MLLYLNFFFFEPSLTGYDTLIEQQAPQQDAFNADVDKPAPISTSAAAPEPQRPPKPPRKEMPKKKKIAIIVGTIVPTVVVAAVILMIVFLRTELVIVQSANTKQDWMNAMAVAFNAKRKLRLFIRNNA